ncbi:hypothetical protein RvVAR0630_33680 [Agrobacterium vitis]|nr:hypothetical protein RvVAR0630_33680 [Agrobacterium vitis]
MSGKSGNRFSRKDKRKQEKLESVWFNLNLTDSSHRAMLLKDLPELFSRNADPLSVDILQFDDSLPR